MLSSLLKYEFTATPWHYASQGGWYFVSLPAEMAKEIRENLQWQEERLGTAKAKAQTGNSEWNTAIWFDTKHMTYLLPLKAEIRKKENIAINHEISRHPLDLSLRLAKELIQKSFRTKPRIISYPFTIHINTLPHVQPARARVVFTV
ncbi:MAG: DUF1905 domain-containing protein [Bacteroidales bacterium]